MNPDQTAQGSSLIWVQIVRNIDYLRTYADKKGDVVTGRKRLILIFLGTFILTI